MAMTPFLEELGQIVAETIGKQIAYEIAVEDSNLALYCIAVEANYPRVETPEDVVLLALFGVQQIKRRAKNHVRLS